MGDKISLAELYPLIAEGLSSGGTYRFYPKGRSMLPLICENKDSVVLSPVKDLKKGDIVLYRRTNGMFVIHRIIDISDTFSMCGDNQFRLEHGILPNQILAKVSAIYKKENLMSFDNKKYLCYVKILPIRRFSLKATYYAKIATRKLFKGR